MKKVLVAIVLLCCTISGQAQKSNAKKADPLTDRTFWLQQMDKMTRPVIRSLAHDSLRFNMPQVTSLNVDNREHRIKVQYVEVLGRALRGIAPWLQVEGGSSEEISLRSQYRKWVIDGLKNALDSNANDFMRFDLGGQQLVDASFLSL